MALARNYVVYMTGPNNIFARLRPRDMNLLVPSSPVLELKLNANTMFEWQQHSQDLTDVPQFSKLLEFLNFRAQASETSISNHKSFRRSKNSDRRGHCPPKPITTFATNAVVPSPNCVLCATSKHPLYACTTFKSLFHEKRLSTLKDNNLCLNCPKTGYFVRECKLLH